MEHDDLTKYITILRCYLSEDFTEEQFDTPMLDLGINSFTAIEIMIIIEEEFHVNLPDSIINPDLFKSPRTLFEGLMMVINGSRGR